MNRRLKYTCHVAWITAGIVVAYYSYRIICPSGKEVFVKATGLPWPLSARVERIDDQYVGPFGVDSVRTVYVRMNPADIRKWIHQRPFHGRSDWREGPMYDGKTPVIKVESMPKNIDELTSLRYAVDQHRPDEGAAMLIVDPMSGDVWLQEWW